MGEVEHIRPGQQQLEGMKDEKDVQLTDLAVAYETARDERLAKQSVERQKKSSLEVMMDEKKVTRYRDVEAGLEVFFEYERNLKVKRIKQSADGDNDGEQQQAQEA